jgi:hypothetical protein
MVNEFARSAWGTPVMLASGLTGTRLPPQRQLLQLFEDRNIKE